jgi:hypothetical protein
VRAVEIQSRFEPCGTGVTCITAIAVKTIANVITYQSVVSEDTGSQSWLGTVDQQFVDFSPVPYNISGGKIFYNGDGQLIIDLKECAGVWVRMYAGSWDVLLSSTWYGHTLGLCGMFNGNVEDDFTSRNGTLLFNASSDHNTPVNVYNYFGLDYHVSEASTLFNYTLLNTTWSHYNPANWTPAFTPVWPDVETEEAAWLLCNNLPGALPAEISACLFDVAVMGPGGAFVILDSVVSRCFQETDGTSCVSPSGCGDSWCNLAGSCTTTGTTSSCQCADGYAPPFCKPAPKQSSSSNSKETSSSHTKPKKSSDAKMSGAATLLPATIIATMAIAMAF